MVRKYKAADIASVIVLLLDFISLYVLNGPKLLLFITAFFILGIGTVVRVYNPSTLESMIKLFDINVIFTVTFYLFSAIKECGYIWIVPSVVACLVALVSIVFMRTDAQMIKGRVLAIVILALVAAIAVFLSTSVAGAAGSVLVSGWGVVERIVLFFWNILKAIITWFMNLFPKIDPEGPTTNPFEFKIELPQMAENDSALGALAIGALGVFIVGALVAIIAYIVRNGMPKLGVRGRVQVTKKKKTRFSLALAKLFEDILHEIKMLIYMTRGNALAKYYRIVYAKRFSVDHKKKSETPREFLTRVSDLSSDFILEVEQDLYR